MPAITRTQTVATAARNDKQVVTNRNISNNQPNFTFDEDDKEERLGSRRITRSRAVKQEKVYNPFSSFDFEFLSLNRVNLTLLTWVTVMIVFSSG